jgi:hypothetical protein
VRIKFTFWQRIQCTWDLEGDIHRNSILWIFITLFACTILQAVAQTTLLSDSLISYDGSFRNKVIGVGASLNLAWGLTNNYMQTFYYDSRRDKAQLGNQHIKYVSTIYVNKELNRLDTLQLLDDGMHFDNEAVDDIYGNYRVGKVTDFQTDEIIIDAIFDSVGLLLTAYLPPVTFVPAAPKILSPRHQSVQRSPKPIVQWLADTNSDGGGIILLGSPPRIGGVFGDILWQKIYDRRLGPLLADTVAVRLTQGKTYHLIVWSYVSTRYANGQWNGAAYSMEWSAFSIDTMLQVQGPSHIVQAYPNPFNKETIVCWNQDTQEEISLGIYDMLGREVKSLVNGMMPAGQHFVVWDSTSRGSTPVSSGVYILWARFRNSQQSVKLVVSR